MQARVAKQVELERQAALAAAADARRAGAGKSGAGAEAG